KKLMAFFDVHVYHGGFFGHDEDGRMVYENGEQIVGGQDADFWSVFEADACASFTILSVLLYFTGIDKEKKVGAKHNLKEKEQVKIHGILRIGYRYPATWYRYPRIQARLDHVQAWPKRDPRPKWRHDRALATPRRGLSSLTTPRCGREAHKHSRTAPSPCLSMARANGSSVHSKHRILIQCQVLFDCKLLNSMCNVSALQFWELSEIPKGFWTSEAEEQLRHLRCETYNIAAMWYKVPLNQEFENGLWAFENDTDALEMVRIGQLRGHVELYVVHNDREDEGFPEIGYIDVGGNDQGGGDGGGEDAAVNEGAGEEAGNEGLGEEAVGNEDGNDGGANEAADSVGVSPVIVDHNRTK
ncbi:hypothetical protein PIB30_072299, partial [Stylosanthes scabra]|nr:hypothetical protein [Stylosanthes scabra]